MLKIGHRGAKAHIAENTLASFEEAFRLGADGIELDVHRCATGELIVIHDFTVDRTSNGSGEVSKMAFNDLRKLVVDGKYQIPTLQEVLDLAGPDRFINIEMKGRHTAHGVSDIVEEYIGKGFSYDNIIVSSFQHEELEAMYAINKRINLGVLTQASVTEAWELAEKVNAKALHPHFSLLTESNVKKAQDAGFNIYTWTVNEPEDIARIKSYGVDGIISDYPERL